MNFRTYWSEWEAKQPGPNDPAFPYDEIETNGTIYIEQPCFQFYPKSIAHLNSPTHV